MDELLNRVVRIWGYTISHNFLLLRSPLVIPHKDDGYTKHYEYNIDIEFVSVEYMNIPTAMNGIRITEVNENGPEKLQHFLQERNLYIFEIESEHQKYHIVASGYLVGKSKSLTEDKISNMNLKYDEVVATSRD